MASGSTRPSRSATSTCRRSLASRSSGRSSSFFSARWSTCCTPSSIRGSGRPSGQPLMAERLLDVADLKVHFSTEDGVVRAVDGVSFSLDRGKVLGIVGESGSGKSVTAMTILGLTRSVNTKFEGAVDYKGEDLLKLNESALRRFRGNEIAMIFQDPMTSLNPVYKIGAQIV